MSDLVLSGDFNDFNDSVILLGITMRNNTSIGEVNGLGKVELSAVEIVDVDNRTINYYVQFSVTSSSGQGRTGNGTLSLEATSRIVAAIDRLKL